MRIYRYSIKYLLIIFQYDNYDIMYRIWIETFLRDFRYSKHVLIGTFKRIIIFK